MMHRFSLVVSALAVAFAPISLPAQTPASKDLAHQLNDAYVSVFDKVSPSVVVIEIEKNAPKSAKLPGFYGNAPTPDSDDSNSASSEKSEGSGIICRPDGFIYTNHHVVAEGGKITVILKDGRSFPAKVIGSDAYSEVAVIKIEAKDLPAAEFADSDKVRVGQLACVIGSPFALTYSFTTGVISAKGRNKIIENGQRWGGMFEDFLQTDASINPGNSGGPLLDIDGKVVGMNTIIQDFNRGLGFAISSNLLQKMGQEIIATGKVARPYLGIGIDSVKNGSNQRDYVGLKSGVIVTSLQNGTPAFRSGLRPGDVILKVDEEPVAEASNLQREVQKKKVGQTVQLTVWRGGKQITLPIVTGEMPVDMKVLAANTDDSQPDDSAPDSATSPADATNDIPPSANGSAIGLDVQTLTSELAEMRKSKAQKGVIVTQVADGSEAAVASVGVGDVITEVNGAPVIDEKSFIAALAKTDPKKGALFFVERESGSAYIVMKPGE